MMPDIETANPEEEGKRAADVVVALSFGTGATNEALATIASDYSRSYHIPVICQKEIAHYLQQDKAPEVLAIPQAPDSYLDTRGALSAAKKFCSERGWTQIVLVCHPDHRKRAALTAERLSLRVVAATANSVPYDKSSAQWWTRNKFLFGIWNGVASLYYRATDWI
jgi:hypothetical protein